MAVILQRFKGHYGPQIGAADTNIDHSSNALARVAFPGPAANLPSKLRHFVENCVNLGNNIRTIGKYLFAFGSAERNMKDGPLLGHVDLVARKHRVYVFAQTGLLRKLNQQTDRVGRDTVLRIVKVQSQSFQREAFAALRVAGEKPPEVYVLNFYKMLVQRGPSRPVPKRRDGVHGSRSFHFIYAALSAAALVPI